MTMNGRRRLDGMSGRGEWLVHLSGIEMVTSKIQRWVYLLAAIRLRQRITRYVAVLRTPLARIFLK